ncbi:MAG: hypothetical protein JGK38_31145 [Microcoleus sp. PH2017_15_JOR_U_A]|uniref:hypothetical protein n=1 Tax=unclassified Microcoleus TaxID=2642155 RepID=UPI001D27E2C8|nr:MULTISPECIES: hypothetical protein [unclassified Microcoleus]TAF84063.1 MAG: hypothetical protein EAZ49_31015 [Oscillatoriales cyanobacterium]MCC3451626.1 hypothetical protein [Microcoleus sp. PH2017_09_SFU_O_A]MCC3500980.1 hypothetical protein [Microcoleus sp. PH2017_15_JOR_U_A]MCC3565865.1 hypothetical protein [Microcoleus sp. PH2017_31_RDM_U_A]MCC3578130.1 hypothetical protein [Microcoleus sp. PH2017_32_RDM_D_A]
MTLNLLDTIGNWNSQLFRELKGRLKMGNMAIASVLSLSSQLVLFLSSRSQIPVAPLPSDYKYPIHHRFCTGFDGNTKGDSIKCIQDAAGNFIINWPSWWLEIFVYLSIFSAIALLVAGTYMLVSDLDKEERRGTLNFIRLSPQSANTIFLGKILGVPILLYLAAILAVPLHLYSGLAAQIPLHHILCFDIAMVASCALFYSGAMLFGLTTSWLGGFQPWLASAAVLGFISTAFKAPSVGNAADLLAFFSPAAVLKQVAYQVNESSHSNLNWLTEEFDSLEWFHLQIGKNLVSSTALSLLICAVATYWIYQGWQRRFPNPTATVLSKRQSYLLVISYQSIILGFALQSNKYSLDEIVCLSIPNLMVFLALIAALTSERQALYDWARYRKQIVPSSQKLWRKYPILDLIWSEKSPAPIAIAINLLSSTVILTPWLLVNHTAFPAMIAFINLILIYAGLTQLFMFAKIRNQAVWATCTVGGAILLPPIILSVLSLYPAKAPFIWLSLVFPIFGSSSALRDQSIYDICVSILCQWTVLVLLNLQLRRQLRIAGESASKALLKA